MVPPASHRVPRVRWYSGYCRSCSNFAYGIFTLFDLPSQTIRLSSQVPYAVRNPKCKHLVWPLSRSLAATWEISVDFSSWSYLDVSVHPVPFLSLCIGLRIHTHCGMWVPPFGHLRVTGYVLLTAAFRSLSRPSSAPSA